MTRTRWLFPFFGLFFATPFACSDDTSGTGGTGPTGKPCEREDECDDEDSCTFDFCIDGFCQNNQAVNGPQPGAQQTDGDCKELVCNGGVAEEVNDDDDTPEDMNNDCTVPVCSEGVLGDGPAEPGQFCQQGNSGGVCDATGTCGCEAPSDDLPHFVHPTEGTDDATHGGAWGACAFRTLDYALEHATGEIILIEGPYDSASVTFPIVLTGQQRLRCATMDEQLVTTISGAADDGSGALVTVDFTGTSNGIQECIVDGGGTADAVVRVSSAGMGDVGHYIYRSDIGGSAAAVVSVAAAGDNLQIGETRIHDGTTFGLNVTGTAKSGYLGDNVFEMNGSDVTCSEAMPDLNGDGNDLATCATCENCPF
jgi:hypothetical protein